MTDGTDSMNSIAPVYQIPAPESFNFQAGEGWSNWKSRFERFRVASGLNNKPEPEQVNSLVYLMGQQAEDIFVSFNLSEEDANSFRKVMDKFDNYFIPSRNIIYDRYKFYMRCQEEGETVEDFVTSLHTLVQHCKFPVTFQDELIRDRIVCGIKDKKISERLQLEKDLTLDKAVTVARQAEIIKKQQETFNVKASTDRIVKKTAFKKKSHPPVKQGGQKQEGQTSCFWCGQANKHKKSECPASKAKCNKCFKLGHFARVCRSTKPQKVHEIEQSDNNVFLDRIEEKCPPVTVNSNTAKWNADITVFDTTLNFKIDTGADVTVVSQEIYNSKLKHLPMVKTDKEIFGPGGNTLEIVGLVTTNLRCKENVIKDKIYIVKGLERPLLSCKASEKLCLVQRIQQVTAKFNPVDKFPNVFNGLGKIQKSYKIKLKQNALPYAITVPRRVPLPLRKTLQVKLQDMEKKGIIESVDELTEWCAPLVIVPKKCGDIRLCVDLSELNKNIEREIFPMNSVEYTLSQFENAELFSIIDANSGYWQIPLDPETSHLTAFITPFGRFKFKRLPFGIKSAPELFQKRMRETIGEMEGVVGLMDEFVIFGKTLEEHDKRLFEVLQKLEKSGWTLNKEKCKFREKEISFLGHLISKEGVKPDPKKAEAISMMPPPENVKSLKRFLGMANFLNKFIPKMADTAKPLYDLLRADVEWTWGSFQEKAFKTIKDYLCTTPGLAWYNPNRETLISSDASSYGLGAVLYQKQDDNWKPVMYASRTLSEVERRYAQIEKEALGMVWAAEKFHNYIIGLTIIFETDHKPLIPIFMSKPLDCLTPRLQRLKMRLMRYEYVMKFTPGKNLISADTLSRSPLNVEGNQELAEDIAAYVQGIIDGLPASDEKLSEIWSMQKKDHICQKLDLFCRQGWPEKQCVPIELQRYWEYRHSISLQQGLLMKDARIVIPECMQQEILQKLHVGHQGITKCRARARDSVWWLGLSTQLQKMISNCPNCIREQVPHKEPLIPSDFPKRPWQVLGADLLKLKNEWYLIVSDYYSRFIEVAKLQSLTSQSVINHMKAMFARHGIPEVVRGDNGTQFAQVVTSSYMKFAEEYGFKSITSSPKFAQSNGFIEAMVKNFKQHFKKSGTGDKALMLLALRTAPLENGYSPAELLMGRRLRTQVPMSEQKLTPKLPNMKELVKTERDQREKKKINFDRHHGVKELPPLSLGQTVWIKDMRTYGKVKDLHECPRSYIVESPKGLLRRNRIFLNPSPIPPGFDTFEERNSETPVDEKPEIIQDPKPTEVVSDEQCPELISDTPVKKAVLGRPKRTIKKPIRFKDYTT